MISWTSRWRLAFLGIEGLFGHRSPPEPEVIPQMAPQKGPTGLVPEPPTPKFERGPSAKRPAVPPDEERFPYD